jgi:hypothetical protein
LSRVLPFETVRVTRKSKIPAAISPLFISIAPYNI